MNSHVDRFRTLNLAGEGQVRADNTDEETSRGSVQTKEISVVDMRLSYAEKRVREDTLFLIKILKTGDSFVLRAKPYHTICRIPPDNIGKCLVIILCNHAQCARST